MPRDDDHLYPEPCVICGTSIYGFGNNPAPVRYTGRCCSDCNTMRVIPERMRRLSQGRPMRGEDES